MEKKREQFWQGLTCDDWIGIVSGASSGFILLGIVFSMSNEKGLATAFFVLGVAGVVGLVGFSFYEAFEASGRRKGPRNSGAD